MFLFLPYSGVQRRGLNMVQEIVLLVKALKKWLIIKYSFFNNKDFGICFSMHMNMQTFMETVCSLFAIELHCLDEKFLILVYVFF